MASASARCNQKNPVTNYLSVTRLHNAEESDVARVAYTGMREADRFYAEA